MTQHRLPRSTVQIRTGRSILTRWPFPSRCSSRRSCWMLIGLLAATGAGPFGFIAYLGSQQIRSLATANIHKIGDLATVLVSSRGGRWATSFRPCR